MWPTSGVEGRGRQGRPEAAREEALTTPVSIRSTIEDGAAPAGLVLARSGGSGQRGDLRKLRLETVSVVVPLTGERGRSSACGSGESIQGELLPI